MFPKQKFRRGNKKCLWEIFFGLQDSKFYFSNDVSTGGRTEVNLSVWNKLGRSSNYDILWYFWVPDGHWIFNHWATPCCHPGNSLFYDVRVGKLMERISNCQTVCWLCRTLPGQGMSLHFVFEAFSPWHFLPPCFGPGFEQFLTRVFKPEPQLVEQTVQLDHVVQPPSTVRKLIIHTLDHGSEFRHQCRYILTPSLQALSPWLEKLFGVFQSKITEVLSSWETVKHCGNEVVRDLTDFYMAFCSARL